MFEKTEADLKTLLGIRATADYFATRITCTGTGANEACLQALAPLGKGLIISNGFFGDRIAQQAMNLHVDHTLWKQSHSHPIDVAKLSTKLEQDPDVRWAFFVSHETRTGLKNPMTEVGVMCKKYGLMVAADVVSSAFAYPIDIETAKIDLAVASSAKALMAAPGIGIVFTHVSSAEKLAKLPRNSYYLDLLEEFKQQRETGEPRFAQPVVLHAALAAACDYLLGIGVENHMERIQRQMDTLIDHLEKLGIPALLDKQYRSGVAVNFRLPNSLPYPQFTNKMEQLGYYLLYGIPGDTSHFQVSTIGDLSSEHVTGLQRAFTEVFGRGDSVKL